MMFRFFLMTILLGFSSQSFAKLKIGESAPELTLKGDDGGRVTGEPWSSEMIKDKVWILFYVDPDVKDLNDDFAKKLKAKKFDRSKFGSIAIINMEATWLPNFAIASSLKEKQEEHPHTVYVKDMDKIVVKKWGLDDDNSCIVVFDKKGTVSYIKNGKLDDNEITSLLSLIESKL